MGLLDKLTRLLDGGEDYYQQEEDYALDQEEIPQELEEKRPSPSPSPSSRIIAFQKQDSRKGARINVMEPLTYPDAEKIADALIAGEAVLINFKRMEASEAKRVIDFLCGVAYAIGGDVQKVRDEIFLSSPANIQIKGDLTDEDLMAYHQQY